MCTAITIKSRQGDYFFGRTLDFITDIFKEADPLHPVVGIWPAGATVDGQIESWTARYAFGGVAPRATVALFDGVNEAGLAGELNALDEQTWAPVDAIRADGRTPLLTEEVVSYFLSRYATVREVRDHADEYACADVDFAPLAAAGPFSRVPSHFIFTDASGDSVVLEPLHDGRFTVLDSIGVLTNSPTYDWQVTNLRNYVQLQGFNAGHTQLGETTSGSGVLLRQIGYGSGLLGIPGDYTSTSRFVRAAFLSRYIDDFDSAEGIGALRDVFASVVVPRGIEKSDPSGTYRDSTQYWSGYDLTNRAIYVSAHGTNATIRRTVSDVTEPAVYDIPLAPVYA